MFKYRTVIASTKYSKVNNKLKKLQNFIETGLVNEDNSLRVPYIYAKNNFDFVGITRVEDRLLLIFKDDCISETSLFKAMMCWLEKTFEALELSNVRLDYAIYDDEKLESTDETFFIIPRYHVLFFTHHTFKKREFNLYSFAYKVASVESDSLELIHDGKIVLKSKHITLYEANIISMFSEEVIKKYNSLLEFTLKKKDNLV